MAYIYCSKIVPDTQEDVNLAFRENGIPAELFVGDGGIHYVAPVLSWAKWSVFPQSDKADQPIADGWDNAIQGGTAFMAKNRWLKEDVVPARWQRFDATMRCSKMEACQREQDIPKLSALLARS
ncbi:hypothetical protein [Ruegeria lacuscaerulensis]|uniref:hypothetical protein n=1 Tax=Ruegeria lacuscaerulensis TaxID=55218 RepID=UPI0014800197|nr:hypothetical protein [Ruegeria lacuscaerulensis]